MKPRPKRQPENVGFEIIWSEFREALRREDREGMSKWFRTQLGRLQYFSKWFQPEMQICLSQQYQFLKWLQDEGKPLSDFTDAKLTDIQTAFTQLFDATTLALSPLYTKAISLDSFKGTLIVTDANKNAWCGIIFIGFFTRA